MGSGLNKELGFGSLLLSALAVLSVLEHRVQLLGWSPCVAGQTRGPDSFAPFPCVGVVIVLQSGAVMSRASKCQEKHPHVSMCMCVLLHYSDPGVLNWPCLHITGLVDTSPQTTCSRDKRQRSIKQPCTVTKTVFAKAWRLTHNRIVQSSQVAAPPLHSAHDTLL